MGFNLRALKKAMDRSDKIITPALTEWLVVHSDDPLEDHIVDVVHNLLTTKPRYRGLSFSASSAGSCHRAQIYGYLDMLKQTPDPQLANIFMDGKWRHLRWQAMMLSAGIIEDAEYPLPWVNQRAMGTVDAFGIVPEDHPRNTWRGQEFGVELKGVSTFQFPKYDSPIEKHLNQVARYFLISGWPLFCIIYEDKTTQAFDEWVFERDNPDMAQRIAEQRDELSALNLYVANKVLPERLPECMSLRGFTFKDCPYGRDRTGPCARVTEWPRQGQKP
jgi:hypothetical protein